MNPHAAADARSPTVHLIDDDQAVRDSLALLIGTVGLRVQPWADPQAFRRSSTARASAPSCSTCACPASAA
jgi:FixJ family two-component response regulator